MSRLIEELSLNARPALNTLLYDGWVVRLANGYTKRGNSVSPLYKSSLDTQEKITYCEQIYAQHALPTIFKITPFVQPENLDNILEQRGYVQDGHTSVQLVNLTQSNWKAPAGDVILSPTLTTQWKDAYCRLSHVESRHTATLTQIFENVVPMQCFVALQEGNEIVATGRAILERGYAKLTAIVIDANRRNQGLGKQLVSHLLHWAQTNGAHHAYLPVEKDNAPALHLYASFGFREIYTYWYRIKNLPLPH